MSLSAQIEEMEEDLHDARRQVEDLERENWELFEFVDFVDKTNPELRVAYDAAKTLEGTKT